jgi:hypothetical protein
VPALTIARVGLGLSAIVKGLDLWPLLAKLTGDPRMIEMPLAPWPRLSPAATPWLVAAWVFCGLAVAAGIRVPLTGTLLAALVGYVVTLDQQTYSNHLYLLSILSLLLALAHTRHRETALALLRAQLVIVYAFAAASKVNPEFLTGSAIAANLNPAFAFLATGPAPAALAYLSIAAEAFVAWRLWRPGQRLAGLIVGVALHAAFIVTIRQTLAMIVFAVMCLCLYPLYLPRERSA